MWATALATVLSAFLLLLVGPASARVVAVTGPRTHAIQSPTVSGRAVAWLEARTSGRTAVHVARPGRPTVVIPAAWTGFSDSGPNSGGTNVGFSASATHMALVRESFATDEFEGDFGSVALRAGPLGADRPPLVLRCSLSDDWPTAKAALAGRRLAYTSTPCRGRSTLAVRDLVTGNEWRVEEPRGRYIDVVKAAGRYVAMVASQHVLVVDAARKAVRLELDLPTAPDPAQIDIARDGSLAVMTGPSFDRCDGRVVRYSPTGRPDPAITRACRLVAAVSSGTVLERRRKATFSIVHADRGTSGLRTVVDLGRRVLQGADADGARLVWALARCSRATEIRMNRLSARISVQPRHC